MSAADLASVAAGLAVLAIVAWDVFITTLQHWHGAGPLGERVAHGAWRLAVGVLSAASPARRRRWLGLLGPALIPLLLGIWASLTVLGFALLMYPLLPGGFAPDTGVPPPSGFGDVLHFSGVSFFTIGYGDIVPVAPAARALGVLEGGSGFALVTLAISYFASVAGAYSSQRSLALMLYAQADDTADAARLLAAHLAGGADPTALHLELARIRDGLAGAGSAYGNYPILHYFIARHPRESLLRLLFVAHDLSLLLDTAVSPDQPELAHLGRRSGLGPAAGILRQGLEAALVGGAPRPEGMGDGAAFIERRWTERFDDARRRLRAAGVPVREGAEAAEAYCAGRRAWEPTLRAACAALGDDWEEVTGGL